MKRIAIFFIFLTALVSKSMAQQINEFSLEQENAFALNPAYAGMEGYLHVQATFRKQFMQITQSPYTAYLAATGQIASKHIGLGGYLIDDVTGPTSRIGASVSAAYNLQLTKKRSGHYSNGSADHILSFGVSLSVMQYRLDATQLLLNNPGDPQLYTSNGTKIFPDASFGVLYKWKDVLYAGVSVPQIMGLDIRYHGADGTAAIKTVQQLNTMIGGKYAWDRDKFSIEPFGALRWENGAPPQGDIGLRFNMVNMFWVGAYYRSISYGVFEAGIKVKDIFTLGYSYNANLSAYRSYIGATHEISLGVVIPKVSKVWRGVGAALRF